jgi:hypothetical protein
MQLGNAVGLAVVGLASYRELAASGSAAHGAGPAFTRTFLILAALAPVVAALVRFLPSREPRRPLEED